jgi:hypothetical protein
MILIIVVVVVVTNNSQKNPHKHINAIHRISITIILIIRPW